MVLAAGLGSRLKPFVNDMPKPLIPVLGVPCIDFSLLNFHDFGVSDVTVNLHAHADRLQQYLKDFKEPGFSFHLSDERDLLMGSAGGFRKALPHFQGRTFLAQNADVLCRVDLDQLCARHEVLKKKHGVLMTLAIMTGNRLQDQSAEYTEIQIDEDRERIMGLGAKVKQRPFFTGVAVYEPECFQGLALDRPSEFADQVLKPLIAQGKVGVFWYSDFWIDIGSPELWWAAHFEIKKRYDAQQLPLSWIHRISEKIGNVQIDETLKTVCYDQSPVASTRDVGSTQILNTDGWISMNGYRWVK